MADREVMSERLTHLSGHINTVQTNNKREVKNSECNASVPLIALTAVTNVADEQAADIPFYALVDKGADTSLCTRVLAEKLFGWKPKDEISISFLKKRQKATLA